MLFKVTVKRVSEITINFNFIYLLINAFIYYFIFFQVYKYIFKVFFN